MKAIITQKTKSVDTAYGTNIGGYTKTGQPTYIKTEKLDNVTSVTIGTENNEEVYSITHQTGDDVAPHTSNYDTKIYNLVVIGG